MSYMYGVRYVAFQPQGKGTFNGLSHMLLAALHGAETDREGTSTLYTRVPGVVSAIGNAPLRSCPLLQFPAGRGSMLLHDCSFVEEGAFTHKAEWALHSFP